MPSAAAALAASAGWTLPALFTPSVSRTTIFDLASLWRSRLTDAASAEPIAVPSSPVPIATRDEALLQPVVVERQRADQERLAGEGDDAHPIVRAARR